MLDIIECLPNHIDGAVPQMFESTLLRTLLLKFNFVQSRSQSDSLGASKGKKLIKLL